MDFEGIALGTVSLSIGILVICSIAGDYFVEQKRRQQLQEMELDLGKAATPLGEFEGAAELEISDGANKTLSYELTSMTSDAGTKIDNGKWMQAMMSIVGGLFTFFFKFMTASFIPVSMFPPGLELMRILLVVPMWIAIIYVLFDVLMRIVDAVIPF